jgi:hypothetical protein
MINPPISYGLDELLKSVMESKYIASLYLVEEREKNYYVFEYSENLAP